MRRWGLGPRPQSRRSRKILRHLGLPDTPLPLEQARGPYVISLVVAALLAACSPTGGPPGLPPPDDAAPAGEDPCVTMGNAFATDYIEMAAGHAGGCSVDQDCKVVYGAVQCDDINIDRVFVSVTTSESFAYEVDAAAQRDAFCAAHIGDECYVAFDSAGVLPVCIDGTCTAVTEDRVDEGNLVAYPPCPEAYCFTHFDEACPVEEPRVGTACGPGPELCEYCKPDLGDEPDLHVLDCVDGVWSAIPTTCG